MRRALQVAARGAKRGEVPIGACIVWRDEVLATACNRRESSHDASAHAEIIAIRKACKKLGDWRLEGATLYVTMEPCLMCYGAAVQSRIGEIIYACDNKKNPDYLRKVYQEWPHGPRMLGGIEQEKAIALLNQFFKGVRRASS